MSPVHVLILDHSYIRRFHDFLRCNYNSHKIKNLNVLGNLQARWRGIGRRKVSKTRHLVLGVVREFAPNVVVLQLGSNDLTSTSVAENRSAFEELTRLLHGSYEVEVVCVFQTLNRRNKRSFNAQVNI